MMFAFYSPPVKSKLRRSRYNFAVSLMSRTSLIFIVAALVALAEPGTVSAQELLRLGVDGDGYLGPADLAVLASDEQRDDLPCSVEDLKPALEYDLNFRAGYNAKISLASLAGPGNTLRVVFRITPLDSDQEPTYMQHRYLVPNIEEGAEGNANLPGQFRLGPGRYKVDWLMRNQAEKVCASSWEIKAETLEGFEKLAASPTTSLVEPFREEVFYEEPPVMRPRGELRHVKLLVNFSSSNVSMAGLSEYDLKSVVSMLRAISKEPQFGEFSVVAYHAQRERVFFEQHRATQIDFPALGEALDEIDGGTVDFETLQDKESSRVFLQELFDTHVTHGESDPDAIVFIGPKLVFDRAPKTALLTTDAITSAPIFYFTYNRDPRTYPWRDAISSGLSNQAVTESNIARAKDFGQALRTLLDQLNGVAPVTAEVPGTTEP